MKNANRLLITAAVLGIPATGAAQEFTHLSIGIGLASPTHFADRHAASAGSAHHPRSGGASAGFGASAYGSSLGPGRFGYYHDYRGYGHRGGWRPFDCWDFFWDCDAYVLFGHPGFGWWNPYLAWWWPSGLTGWPSLRLFHFHRVVHGPFWYGGWDWRHPHYHGVRHHHPRSYVYHDRGSGYVTPRGYRSHGRAKPRGHSGDRIVRGSPLFGPRYKEDPRDRVTDNGRNRRGSKAVPRGTRAKVGEAGGRRRSGDYTRRARPRSEAAPVPTRTRPPKLRTRTGSPSGVRATPTRTPSPKARTGTGGRPAPAVRTTPTRRTTPVTRPATRRRAAPAVRTTPTRRTTPGVRPSTSRRSNGTARSAPSRTSSSRAKPTPPTKRSRPKVRTPAGRPPPKASAPRRSAPRARPVSRRSGNSKPPPRRGGRD